jgi:hypothetical protein
MDPLYPYSAAWADRTSWIGPVNFLSALVFSSYFTSPTMRMELRGHGFPNKCN